MDNKETQETLGTKYESRRQKNTQKTQHQKNKKQKSKSLTEN